MDVSKIDHEKVKKSIKNLTIKIGKCFEGEDINIVIESLSTALGLTLMQCVMNKSLDKGQIETFKMIFCEELDKRVEPHYEKK